MTETINKKSQPMFSIIIPAYNNEKYVGKCIESVLSQTFTDFELIVVNDGSTDKTYEIIKKYALKDSRIRVIDKKNGGVSSARNIALDNATGKYLLFLDSDDWYESCYCHDLSEILSHNNADIIFATQFIREEEDVIEIGKISIMYPDSIIDMLNSISPYSFAMTCVKKSFWRDDLRFNEKLHYHEDGEMLIRLLMERPQIFYYEKPSFHYRPGSITHSRFTKKTLSQIDSYRVIVNHLQGINRTLDKVLNKRCTAIIAGMATQAALDKEHDKGLDYVLKCFARENINKAIFSNSRISFKVKTILTAISPRFAYFVIYKMIRGQFNAKQ